MELHVWPGEYGLPSIDPRSIQMMAYCKFSGAPIRPIYKTGSLWGSLPSFKHGNRPQLTELKQVIDHLKSQNYNANHTLNGRELADIAAYGSHLRTELEPAWLYMLWMNNQNFENFTRAWYAKKVGFPWNFWFPGKLRSQAEEQLRGLLGPEIFRDALNVETVIMTCATRCITTLSERLGSRDFFFGKHPTSFDAIVFSYLVPILNVPLPNNQLLSHLQACDNLVRYVKSILQKYFPNAGTRDSANKNGTNTESSKSANTTMAIDDFPHKWRDIILWGLFNATVLVTYAFMSGLYKSRWLRRRREEDDEGESQEPELPLLFDDEDEDEDDIIYEEEDDD